MYPLGLVQYSCTAVTLTRERHIRNSRRICTASDKGNPLSANVQIDFAIQRTETHCIICETCAISFAYVPLMSSSLRFCRVLNIGASSDKEEITISAFEGAL